jgi:hypothetical protein
MGAESKAAVENAVADKMKEAAPERRLDDTR